MNQYKNISMSDSNDTSIDLKSNEASFLQRPGRIEFKRPEKHISDCLPSVYHHNRNYPGQNGWV